MNPRELLLAAVLLCAVVASMALIRAADWTRAHWILVVLLAAGLVALGMVLWERRRAHYWRELEVQAEVGQWGRVSKLREWPMRCRWCSVPVWSWRDAGVHMDAASSCCAAFLAREDERAQVVAEVLDEPGRGWPAVLPDEDQSDEDQ